MMRLGAVTAVDIIIRFNLDEADRTRFEQLAKWCNRQYAGTNIPCLE
jgi:hypothetical protein